jgi:hypothetical protein
MPRHASIYKNLNKTWFFTPLLGEVVMASLFILIHHRLLGLLGLWHFKTNRKGAFMTLPHTAERVNLNTMRDYNQRIEEQTERNIAYYAAHPERIDLRLAELEREWDIERTLEANSATLSLAGMVLGVLAGRKWFVFPALAGGFLLQNALQGWCPPLPVFRRMGVRTQTEIERERYALKALRGDFSNISDFNSITDADTATEGSVSRISQRVLQAVK